jgi:hypothetical protein
MKAGAKERVFAATMLVSLINAARRPQRLPQQRL